MSTLSHAWPTRRPEFCTRRIPAIQSAPFPSLPFPAIRSLPLASLASFLLPLSARSILFILLLVLPAHAPAQDHSRLPIDITADQARFEEATGTSTYSGDVQVQQGTLRLWADRLTIHTAQGRPVRIESEGQPARVEMLDEEGRPRIATARFLEYRLLEDILWLRQEARLQAASGEASGAEIVFNLRTGALQAERGPEERVRIRLDPVPLPP
jgi:lipopolysaccharide export system protein LptA